MNLSIEYIEVMVADDSKFLRKYISDVLSKEKEINIIGTAQDGLKALELLDKLNPDVLILDLLMPKKNGLDVLKEIMICNPIPTIILSTLSPSKIDFSMQALLIGAFDYIIKPGGIGAKSLPQFRKALIKKVKTAAKSQVKRNREAKSSFQKKKTFRQSRVSEIFQFAKHLKKVEETHQKNLKKEVPTHSPKISDSKEYKKKKSLTYHKNKKSKPKKRNKIKKPKKSHLNPKYSQKLKKAIKKKKTVENIDKIKTRVHQRINDYTKPKPLKIPKQTKTLFKKQTEKGKPSLPFPSLKIVVIGTSVGGPKTLKHILEKIPANLSVPILIVQHLKPTFVENLAQKLDEICPLHVKVAENGEQIRKKIVYLAPGNKHMKIVIKEGKPLIKTYKGEPVNFFIPSVDVLFNSAAQTFKNQTLGILLTGMGKDGVKGLANIKKKGGRTISESKETCILYGMPRLAAERGIPDLILPNYQIKDYIISFSNIS